MAQIMIIQNRSKMLKVHFLSSQKSFEFAQPGLNLKLKVKLMTLSWKTNKQLEVLKLKRLILKIQANSKYLYSLITNI